MAIYHPSLARQAKRPTRPLTAKSAGRPDFFGVNRGLPPSLVLLAFLPQRVEGIPVSRLQVIIDSTESILARPLKLAACASAIGTGDTLTRNPPAYPWEGWRKDKVSGPKGAEHGKRGEEKG